MHESVCSIKGHKNYKEIALDNPHLHIGLDKEGSECFHCELKKIYGTDDHKKAMPLINKRVMKRYDNKASCICGFYLNYKDYILQRNKNNDEVGSMGIARMLPDYTCVNCRLTRNLKKETAY